MADKFIVKDDGGELFEDIKWTLNVDCATLFQNPGLVVSKKECQLWYDYMLQLKADIDTFIKRGRKNLQPVKEVK